LWSVGNYPLRQLSRTVMIEQLFCLSTLIRIE